MQGKARLAIPIAALLFLSIAVIISADQPEGNFTVTFEESANLDRACFIISITNNQDSNAKFPFKPMLNTTNLNMNKVSVDFYEWHRYDYSATTCNTCNYNVTECVTVNATTNQTSCHYVAASSTDCGRCGSTAEEMTSWRWLERKLVNENKNNGRIRNQFQEVNVKGHETVRYRLCYNFNEMLRSSYGYMYLDVNGKMFYDHENSSWWNATYLKRTCWNLTNPDATDKANVTIKMSLNMTEFDMHTDCSDFEWGNLTASFGYWNMTNCTINGANTTWLIRAEEIKADDTSTICAYYNSSSDNTVDGDIINAGIYGDAFDDADVSDWGTGWDVYSGVTGSQPTANDTLNYIYADGASKVMSINLTSSVDVKEWKFYYSGQETAGNGYIAVSTSESWHNGYYDGGIRADNNDFEIFEVTADTPVKKGDGDFAYDVSPWYDIEFSRTEEGFFHQWTDDSEDTLNNVNLAGQKFNSTATIGLALRQSTDKMGYILFSAWCKDCIASRQAEEDYFVNTAPTVTLISPVTAYSTADQTPSHVFNVSDPDAGQTISCTLFYNSVSLDTNSSVSNATATTITVNATQSDATYTWEVNCTDGTATSGSLGRNITIDSTPPDIVITSIDNITYTTAGTFSLNWSATEGYSAASYSFNGNPNVSIHYGSYVSNASLTGLFNATGSEGYPVFKLGSLIYIPKSSTIYKYHQNGTRHSTLSLAGATSLDYQGLYINSTDIFIVAANNKRIYEYDINGTFRKSWTYNGSTSADSACYDGTYWYMSDIVSDTIYQVYNNGTETGLTYSVSGAVYDCAVDDDYLYVTDVCAETIKRYYKNNGTHSVSFNLRGTNQNNGGCSVWSSTGMAKDNDHIFSVNSLDIAAYKYTRSANTTLTVRQGSNTITIHANDTLGNANSSTVSFYVDSSPPSFSGLSQSGSTCIPNPGVVRLNWEQEDNLDDLTVYCNFTNSSGAVTQITATSQSNSSSASCSQLFTVNGQYSVLMHMEDLSGSIAEYTGSVDVRTVCTGDAATGGGSALTQPIDIIRQFIPECGEGFEFDLFTGRCRLITDSANLTPEQLFLFELARPRFIQIGFNETIPAVNATGITFQVTHTAFLFSWLQLIITGAGLALLVYMSKRRIRSFREGDWKLMRYTLIISIIAFNILSISTAIPAPVLGNIINRATFIPAEALITQPPETTGQVTQELPPGNLITAIQSYASANPMAMSIIIIMIIAVSYVTFTTIRERSK